MKIALCFYGQPRFYKQVFSIWNEIINELNTDVFIHTWFGQDRAKGITDLNELVNDFNPKEIKISNPHKFLDIIPNNSKFETKSFHGIQQSYTLSNCIKTLVNYENDLKTNYDLIIRTRMDIKIRNPKEFIKFVKEINDLNKIYVCSNHWPSGSMFDDNMMIGSAHTIKSIFLKYYDYTIDVINKTNLIPGGEQNIFRYISELNLINNITKVNELDFDLLYISEETLILNQNE